MSAIITCAAKHLLGGFEEGVGLGTDPASTLTSFVLCSRAAPFFSCARGESALSCMITGLVDCPIHTETVLASIEGEAISKKFSRPESVELVRPSSVRLVQHCFEFNLLSAVPHRGSTSQTTHPSPQLLPMH